MITSQQNPLVKRIRKLRQKKYRLGEGAYFVDGLRSVLSAIEAQAKIQRLVYCEELLASEKGRESIGRMQRLGVPTDHLSAEVYKGISYRENPIGLGAIIQIEWDDYRKLSVTDQSIFIGLVEISDPGNLGTVIRTADAAAVSGIIQVGNAVDPFHPTAVKASMGSLFSSPISQESNIDSLITWAADSGLGIVSSSARAEMSFWEVEYILPALLLVGPEKRGLSKQVINRTDICVRIPMSGEASSLNLSVAAGLLLYEMRRATRTIL